MRFRNFTMYADSYTIFRGSDFLVRKISFFVNPQGSFESCNILK